MYMPLESRGSMIEERAAYEENESPYPTANLFAIKRTQVCARYTASARAHMQPHDDCVCVCACVHVSA